MVRNVRTLLFHTTLVNLFSPLSFTPRLQTIWFFSDVKYHVRLLDALRLCVAVSPLKPWNYLTSSCWSIQWSYSDERTQCSDLFCTSYGPSLQRHATPISLSLRKQKVHHCRPIVNHMLKRKSIYVVFFRCNGIHCLFNMCLFT